MKNKIEVEVKHSEFSEVRKFVEEKLKEKRISEGIIREGILVLEEVFVRIIENGVHDDNSITVWLSNVFGEVRIMVGYNGERFDLDFHGSSNDLGAAILEKYEDKIALWYRKRSNTVAIRVRRSYDRVTIMSVIAILLAMPVYIAVVNWFPVGTVSALDKCFIQPVMKLFTNAMIMISSPVTLFSLIRNITDIVVIADSRLNVSRLIGHAAGISFLTTITAVLYFHFLIGIIPEETAFFASEQEKATAFLSDDVIRLIYSLVPENLMEAFADFSPLPIIFIGVVTATAICACNRYFENLKMITDSLNSLVCKMLNILMLFLPLAAFVATLDLLITAQEMMFINILITVIMVIVGICILVLIRMLFMRLTGIDAIDFAKKCIPAIGENLKINHNIDAVTYNIRFCSRRLGIGIERLDIEMPILAQISLAGNCFLLMFIGMCIMSGEGMSINMPLVVTMALIVVALSIGAPGQDGTLIIGLLVICALMGVDYSSQMTLIIFCEILFGRLVSLVNVFSDMATVKTNEFREKKREEKKRNNI